MDEYDINEFESLGLDITEGLDFEHCNDPACECQGMTDEEKRTHALRYIAVHVALYTSAKAYGIGKLNDPSTGSVSRGLLAEMVEMCEDALQEMCTDLPNLGIMRAMTTASVQAERINDIGDIPWGDSL